MFLEIRIRCGGQDFIIHGSYPESIPVIPWCCLSMDDQFRPTKDFLKLMILEKYSKRHFFDNVTKYSPLKFLRALVFITDEPRKVSQLLSRLPDPQIIIIIVSLGSNQKPLKVISDSKEEAIVSVIPLLSSSKKLCMLEIVIE